MTHAPARVKRAPHHRFAIMAALAAMIFVGSGMLGATAQDADPSASSAPASNGASMVNQIIDLRAQMRDMQGQIEELQHQLQQLQQTGKDQYVDLDARLGKLEHATAGTAVPTTSPAKPGPVAPAPAAPAKPMSAAATAAAQTAYDAAFKALRAGNYVESARGFVAFIEAYPQSPLVSNAYYWLGGSYFVTQNYQPALKAFQTLLKDYPDSPKAAEAQLRVADSQIALKDFAAARATLAAVIKANPGTPLEKRARDRMRDIPAQPGGG